MTGQGTKGEDCFRPKKKRAARAALFLYHPVRINAAVFSAPASNASQHEEAAKRTVTTTAVVTTALTVFRARLGRAPAPSLVPSLSPAGVTARMARLRAAPVCKSVAFQSLPTQCAMG